MFVNLTDLSLFWVGLFVSLEISFYPKVITIVS